MSENSLVQFYGLLARLLRSDWDPHEFLAICTLKEIVGQRIGIHPEPDDSVGTKQILQLRARLASFKEESLRTGDKAARQAAEIVLRIVENRERWGF